MKQFPHLEELPACAGMTVMRSQGNLEFESAWADPGCKTGRMRYIHVTASTA